MPRWNIVNPATGSAVTCKEHRHGCRKGGQAPPPPGFKMRYVPIKLVVEFFFMFSSSQENKISPLLGAYGRISFWSPSKKFTIVPPPQEKIFRRPSTDDTPRSMRRLRLTWINKFLNATLLPRQLHERHANPNGTTRTDVASSVVRWKSATHILTSSIRMTESLQWRRSLLLRGCTSMLFTQIPDISRSSNFCRKVETLT